MTRHDARASLLLLAAIAVTLGFKALVVSNGARPDQKRFAHDLAAVLERHDFQSRIIPRGLQSPIIEGSSGSCRLGARVATGGVGIARMFERKFGKIGAVRYVWKGKYVPGIPSWRIQLQELAQRSARRLGHDLALPPVLAVAQNGHCTVNPEIFAGLTMHFRLGPIQKW